MHIKLILRQTAKYNADKALFPCTKINMNTPTRIHKHIQQAAGTYLFELT